MENKSRAYIQYKKSHSEQMHAGILFRKHLTCFHSEKGADFKSDGVKPVKLGRGCGKKDSRRDQRQRWCRFDCSVVAKSSEERRGACFVGGDGGAKRKTVSERLSEQQLFLMVGWRSWERWKKKTSWGWGSERQWGQNRCTKKKPWYKSRLINEGVEVAVEWNRKSRHKPTMDPGFDLELSCWDFIYLFIYFAPLWLTLVSMKSNELTATETRCC